jgi:hypothetical protein
VRDTLLTFPLGGDAVTEREWLAATEPTAMLDHLGGRGSRRKWQLMCLACWELVRHLLSDEWSRKGLAVLAKHPETNWLDQDRYDELDEAYTDVDDRLTNRFWDRLVAGDSELWDAMDAGSEASLTSWDTDGVHAGAAFVTTAAAHDSGRVRALDGMTRPLTAVELARRISANAARAGRKAAKCWRDRQRLHANLVRDIFGNPFRPITLDPAWRTSTAVALARGMYESRISRRCRSWRTRFRTRAVRTTTC